MTFMEKYNLLYHLIVLIGKNENMLELTKKQKRPLAFVYAKSLRGMIFRGSISALFVACFEEAPGVYIFALVDYLEVQVGAFLMLLVHAV